MPLRFLPVDDPKEEENQIRLSLIMANAYLRGRIDWLSREATYSENPRTKTEYKIEQLKSDLAQVRNKLGYAK